MVATYQPDTGAQAPTRKCGRLLTACHVQPAEPSGFETFRIVELSWVPSKLEPKPSRTTPSGVSGSQDRMVAGQRQDAVAMSYDFILLHRQSGQSWDEVLEATERRVEQEMDPPFSPSARAWAERIADRFQAHDPSWSASPASTASTWTGRTTLASRCRCSSLSWPSAAAMPTYRPGFLVGWRRRLGCVLAVGQSQGPA